MFRARPEGPGCDRVKGIVDQKEAAQFEIPYRAGKMIRENYVLLIACEEGAILTYSLIREKESIGDAFRGNLTDFDIAKNLMCVSSGEGPVFVYQGDERLASLTLDDKPYAVTLLVMIVVMAVV